jgi:hypothetical protein
MMCAHFKSFIGFPVHYSSSVTMFPLFLPFFNSAEIKSSTHPREIWNTNIQTSNNNMILQQLVFHTQKIIPATSVQDLNPRPCTDNVHASVLPVEMTAIEPDDGEIPTRKWTSKPLGFLRHIKCRTMDDRFPLSLWEVWFYSSLGVPIPTLIGHSQHCD